MIDNDTLSTHLSTRWTILHPLRKKVMKPNVAISGKEFTNLRLFFLSPNCLPPTLGIL